MSLAPVLLSSLRDANSQSVPWISVPSAFESCICDISFHVASGCQPLLCWLEAVVFAIIFTALLLLSVMLFMLSYLIRPKPLWNTQKICLLLVLIGLFLRAVRYSAFAAGLWGYTSLNPWQRYLEATLYSELWILPLPLFFASFALLILTWAQMVNGTGQAKVTLRILFTLWNITFCAGCIFLTLLVAIYPKIWSATAVLIIMMLVFLLCFYILYGSRVAWNVRSIGRLRRLTVFILVAWIVLMAAIISIIVLHFMLELILGSTIYFFLIRHACYGLIEISLVFMYLITAGRPPIQRKKTSPLWEHEEDQEVDPRVEQELSHLNDLLLASENATATATATANSGPSSPCLSRSSFEVEKVIVQSHEDIGEILPSAP